MSKPEDIIVELLQKFGLSTNASRAYLSLLKNYPATGYEISTRSGIPRSAVYSVLNRLRSRGLISTDGQEPKRYIPIAPSALIETLNQTHDNNMGELQQALDKLDTDEEAFDFWHLHGYTNLIMKLRENIAKAENKIFLSVWAKDYTQLKNEIVAAEERGIEVFLFSFCDLSDPVGTVVSYGLDEKELLKIWNPKVILVVDQMISIMGSTLEIDDSKAIWSKNIAITEIATNHIVLDVTLAGQRLEIDVNPITQQMMRRGDIHLDKLLESETS